MITKSIPLGNLQKVFANFNFSNEEFNSIVRLLIQLWIYNDNVYDITAEFIRTEMDLDELSAQSLILGSIQSLEVIGKQIRAVALTGKLVRYNIIGVTILLELDE